MKHLKFSYAGLFIVAVLTFTSCSSSCYEDTEKNEKPVPTVIFHTIKNNEKTKSGGELRFAVQVIDEAGLDSWRLEVDPVPYDENDDTVEERKKLFDTSVSSFKQDFSNIDIIDHLCHMTLHIPSDLPSGVYDIVAYVKNRKGVEAKSKVRIRNTR